MMTITKNEAKEEIKILEKIVNSKNLMTYEIKTKLREMGYVFSSLGTGKSAYICSRQIKIKNIESKYYLSGEYLVIGCANTQYGKGCIYQGFVKKIV